jgi:hypothetical protein
MSTNCWVEQPVGERTLTAPRQHARIREKRNYTIPKRAVEQQFVVMVHQHHAERVERLARQGLEIAGSRFPMKSVQVKIELRSDDVKDLEAGLTVEKEYHCLDCDGRDEYKFSMRGPDEDPEWTVRTGKAPPGSEIIGDVRITKRDG